VFQDPLASLNPRLRVGSALGEPLAVHRGLRGAQLERRVAALLERVGLGGEVAPRFPHELSGGQRQRVAIARALALEPRLLVCDEIASALDVSVTAQVLERLEGLARELGLALLYVSHDLAAVRHVADRVLVLYLGRPVELGPAAEVLEAPAHPYTRLLVDSAPRLGAGAPPPAAPRGEPPSPLAPPGGCAFHPRCPLAEPRCAQERPLPRRVGPGRVAACHALEPA
jgi:peptide/nickel transport system ATP-binding protein